MAAYAIHDNSATRSDPLRAQRQTVEALLPLRIELAQASESIRRGLEGAIRHARLDLAYTLLRNGMRVRAVGAALPLLADRPGLRSLRDVLSVARGLC